ncbi:MAG: lipid A deacylase LpxR family protein [Alphaproteobacteria bacterium]
MRRAAAALAATLLAAAPAAGETPDGPVFSVSLENDIFADVDGHYTNGVQFGVVSGRDLLPDWMVETARAFPLFAEGGRIRATAGLGQSMYTPADIRVADPPLTDRPYGGWLYVSAGLLSERDDRLDQIQLQLGVVGPAAQAGETQELVHRVINADQPQGWSTQLPNEPGVVLLYQVSERAFGQGDLLGLRWDLTPHAGGALGNVFTHAAAGATVRLGWRLPHDFGPPRIQPGLPSSGFFRPPEGGIGGYLFAGIEGRAVARNIFLDGSTWSDSRHVDRNWLVGDLIAGLAVTVGGTRIAYTHVFRSEEFAGQDGIDQYGAVSLSVRF